MPETERLRWTAAAVLLFLASSGVAVETLRRPWSAGEPLVWRESRGSPTPWVTDVHLVTFDLPTDGSVPTAREHHRVRVSGDADCWFVARGLDGPSLHRRGSELRVPAAPREVWCGPLRAVVEGVVPRQGAVFDRLEDREDGTPARTSVGLVQRVRGRPDVVPGDAMWDLRRSADLSALELDIVVDHLDVEVRELSWNQVRELVRGDVRRLARTVDSFEEFPDMLDPRWTSFAETASLAVLFDVDVYELERSIDDLELLHGFAGSWPGPEVAPGSVPFTRRVCSNGGVPRARDRGVTRSSDGVRTSRTSCHSVRFSGRPVRMRIP